MRKISSVSTNVPSNLVPPAVIAIQNCKKRKIFIIVDLQFSQLKTDLYLSLEVKLGGGRKVGVGGRYEIGYR